MPAKSPIVEIAKKVCPAVVTIVVSKDLPKVESFFLFPFGEQQLLLPQVDKNQKEKTQIGGGSGFIISEDGYVITCNHVVSDTQADYSILLNPKTSFEAKVLARDPLVDIAILKIEEKKFPYIPLGDSNEIELGEMVLAIGNALGEFEDTISMGIISGLSRKITAYGGIPFRSTSLRGLIQTDAAINPGNSGGPLVNMEGKAIGINTAMVLGAQNIGFAIPINYATKILEEIKKFGKIKRPFLGIRYVIINKEIAQVQKIPVDFGALIIREIFGEPAIIPNSCAEKAGLKEYDIILEIDGEKITEQNTLNDILSVKNVGDEIKLKVLRDNKEIEIKIKLEER
ncbi:MAG: S1C family serine protease, partial [Minisyncoccia bacterium]